MLSFRHPTRRTLRGAALAVALLLAGNGAAAAPGAAGVAPTTSVAHILPGDREIARIEALDPANAGVTFVLARGTDGPAANGTEPEPINICIVCDNLA